MTLIFFLSPSANNFPIKGVAHLFPIYRLNNELIDSGFNFKTTNNINKIKASGGDALFLDCRYFQKWPKQEVIAFIKEIKVNFTKVIWFDSVDPSGSDTFWVIEYVDIFAKKQLFVDKKSYTLNNYDKSVRPWIEIDNKKLKYPDYVPCPQNYLHKLRLGWNIGLNDYRTLPKYLRWQSRFSKKLPDFISTNSIRDFDLQYRGQFDYLNNNISFQRHELVKNMQRFKKKYKVITGNYISKNKFVKELRNTKLVISPFGWGEICYRDFEAILNGNVLIKPDMSHIETFPNIYEPDETYVPINWSFEDLEIIVDKILSNYRDYTEKTQNAQQYYKKILSESNYFIDIIRNIVS